MAERYQLPRSCVPPTTRRKDCGHPPSGGSEGGKIRCIREREDMAAFQGGHPPFKGDSPYLRPQPSRAESSPTRSKVLPLRRGGWVPHVMQAGPGQKKPNCRARWMQPFSGYKRPSTFAQTSGLHARKLLYRSGSSGLLDCVGGRILWMGKSARKRQGRPSRGIPTPPGYGYLTHHLP
jgi:hypothetical protein